MYVAYIVELLQDAWSHASGSEFSNRRPLSQAEIQTAITFYRQGYLMFCCVEICRQSAQANFYFINIMLDKICTRTYSEDFFGTRRWVFFKIHCVYIYHINYTENYVLIKVIIVLYQRTTYYMQYLTTYYMQYLTTYQMQYLTTYQMQQHTLHVHIYCSQHLAWRKRHPA